MQPQPLESIASAALVFWDARQRLQAAVDAANNLGLVVPDSFPDAIDHLQDWTASVDSEARGLLPPTPRTPLGLLVTSVLLCDRHLLQSQRERLSAARAAF